LFLSKKQHHKLEIK